MTEQVEKMFYGFDEEKIYLAELTDDGTEEASPKTMVLRPVNTPDGAWNYIAAKACDLLCSQPEGPVPSVYVFGAMAWLAAYPGTLKIGAKHDCGVLAEMAEKYCRAQDLEMPTDDDFETLQPVEHALPKANPRKPGPAPDNPLDDGVVGD